MKRGQTLIEVLIAFAVTVIIGLGLVSAGLATQRAGAGARNEAQATKLTQEYIEKLRVMRDVMGWNLFAANVTASGDYWILNSSSAAVGSWDLNPLPAPAVPCNVASPSPMRGESVPLDKVVFCRKIVVPTYTAGSTSILFRVEVGWMEGSNIRSTQAETSFSRWCGATINPGDSTLCPI